MRGNGLDGRDGLGQHAIGQRGLDFTLIAGLGECRIDGKLTQDVEVVALGDFGEFALTKDFDLPAAVGALDIAHVLDNAKNRDVHLLGHVDCLGDDHRDQVLRARDDDDAIDGQRLEDREGDVARSRRHVDQKVVDGAP